MIRIAREHFIFSMNSTFQTSFFTSTALLLSFYLGIVNFYSKALSTPKQRAWILTALTSAVMIACSIIFAKDFHDSGSLRSMHLLDSSFAMAVAGFFNAYLVTDLVVGTIFTFSEMKFGTGYIHHIVYAFIVLDAVHQNIPGALGLIGIMELPTLILALGQMRKSWRQDALFGITFFVTRIAFHIYMLITVYFAWPNRYYYLYLLPNLPVHMMWFRGWIIQQQRKNPESNQ